MNDKYQTTLDWLFSQIPTFQNAGAAAYKPGLERVTALSQAFGNPHKSLRAIHIAGTNGKGSTTSTLAAILTAAGYNVGLFTSPHLVDFRERIRINGKMISKKEVLAFLDRFRALALPIEPSFFELTTIMAFEHFVRQGVDYAVIECGLGGRLDSTNIISPVLSVITNISLDHTALLGNTLPEIATEKAGIIKPDTPVVIGRAEPEIRRVFADKAAKEYASIVFAQDEPLFSRATFSDDRITYFDTPWGDIAGELLGEYQLENTNTILHALRCLRTHTEIRISPDAVAHGFAHVGELSGLIGRWTTLSRSPRIICDTGHNPGAWKHLAHQLADIPRLSIVLGFVNDKDVDAIFAMMPHNADYFFVQPSVKRALPVAELARIAERHSIRGAVFETVEQGLNAALAHTPSDGTIFIGGSTFTLAPIMAKYFDSNCNFSAHSASNE